MLLAIKQTQIHLLVIVLIIGCNSPEANTRIEVTNSLHKINSSENLIPAKNETFSADRESKVVGDLRFGMNKETVMQIIKNLQKNGDSGFGYYIGQYKYQIVDARYESDSLYSLTIESYSSQKKDIISEALGEESDPECQNLSTFIKAKYGKSNSHEYLKLLHLYTEKWIVGAKTFDLSCTLNNRKGHTLLRIYNSHIEERILQNHQAKSKRFEDSTAHSIF